MKFLYVKDRSQVLSNNGQRILLNNMYPEDSGVYRAWKDRATTSYESDPDAPHIIWFNFGHELTGSLSIHDNIVRPLDHPVYSKRQQHEELKALGYDYFVEVTHDADRWEYIVISVDWDMKQAEIALVEGTY